MVERVEMSPRFLIALVVGLVVGVGGLFALIAFVSGNAIEKGEAYALAKARAVSSAEVRARVGPVVSIALASGESRCLSQTAIPPAGDATFTMLVTGARDHAKLDVRATRDAAGWRLVDTKLRATDDAPFAVASGCSSGSAWGPAGSYGKP